MNGQMWKDVDGRMFWIQQDVSEREGIVCEKSVNGKLNTRDDVPQYGERSQCLNAHGREQFQTVQSACNIKEEYFWRFPSRSNLVTGF